MPPGDELRQRAAAIETGGPDVHAGGRILSRELGRFGDADRGGTTLVVIGGVHGNERAGIIAARRVLETLKTEQPTGFRGRLIAMAGNLAALNHPEPETRFVDHDLNRLFTDEQIELPPQTSTEHEQMQELLASLRAINAQSERMIVLDLHTTSADAPPVVVLEDSIPARSFARRMPLPIYLGFEEELGGLLVDRVTNEMGRVAMVVEGGQHSDPRSILVHEAVIWSALDAAGILPMSTLHGDEPPVAVLRDAVGGEANRVYDIRHLHSIESEDFAMAPGVKAGSRVRPGSTVVAVEGGKPVRAAVRGRVFLPNMQKHKRIGDDGFFIVRLVGEGWLGLSVRLRRQEWLHALVEHLPGVYPCGDGTLCVDADLAGVLKRQVFHLLGYRLICHDRRDAGHGVRRAWRGCKAFFKALLRGPIKGGPDAVDPRFWIVRRHRLDRRLSGTLGSCSHDS